MRGHGHGSPRGRQQELLYDPEIPTPPHAEQALTLVAQSGSATLCTLSVEPEGFPYGSFVTFALHDNSPVFLISEMAEHTKNLRGTARCSLLVAQKGEGDPLARGRVTLVGTCRITEGEERSSAREAFLAGHPNASYYADFQDFHFWKLDVEHVRFIGGYGRMSWVEPTDWSTSKPDPIAPHADRILSHMNADHADTLVLYCQAFSRAQEVSEATMVGIDRYGFEMSAATEQGPRPIRVAFEAPIETAQDARVLLVDLSKKARERLA